ncbi:MAG: glycosyltransferase [Lachnospiraceae bacterium]
MEILKQYRPPKLHEDEQTELLSVIVAAYNIEAYIERGVRSVCEQTYRNLEIIVVDDGSVDATGRILDELAENDSRIRVIHEENGGLAHARNTGIAAAQGSYIGFVDGDDWIDPDMYEKLFSALKDKRADIAVCRYRQVSRTRTLDESVDRAVLFEGQEALAVYVEEREEFSIQNAAWNKLYRKELLIGNPFPEGRWYEDIVFATEALARAGRCIYLDIALYNYIIDREDSIMNCRINSRTFTDQIPAYYDKTKLLKELGREDLALTHDYFFYKRLLLFYWELSKAEDGETYMLRLQEILEKDRKRAEEAFLSPIADPRDRRKLKLFYRSPNAYCSKQRWDEQVVIPCKVRVKRLLGMSK